MPVIDSDEELFRETIKFLNRIRHIRLKGLYWHLIIESCINQVIKKNFKHPTKILDSRYYSFYKKIEILREIGIIDETTFHNLKIANNVRNTLAHGLYVAHSEIEKELDKIKFPKGTKLPRWNQKNKINRLIILAFIEIYRELKIKIP